VLVSDLTCNCSFQHCRHLCDTHVTRGAASDLFTFVLSISGAQLQKQLIFPHARIPAQNLRSPQAQNQNRGPRPHLLNGSLFLSQSTSVLRLSCGTGCSFNSGGGGTGGGGNGGTGGGGGASTGVPEPATFGLFSLGMLGACLRRRRSTR
jgi:uncharacterized membrane protein YgcG